MHSYIEPEPDPVRCVALHGLDQAGALYEAETALCLKHQCFDQSLQLLLLALMRHVRSVFHFCGLTTRRFLSAKMKPEPTYFPITAVMQGYIAVTAILVFLSIVTVIARITSRSVTRAGIGIDDYLVVFAVPLGVGLLVIEVMSRCYCLSLANKITFTC